MKITSKIIVLLMSVLLPMGFAGCSDDDDDMPNPGGEEAPEFVLGQESLKVKIGPENKVTVDIKQGGGEYDAFILDAKVATAEVTDGVIKVEGLANGQTFLMVSDKYNRYRKLPVRVYTVDKIQLSHESFDLSTLLGSSETIKANVILGNGGYEIESDNSAVLASINEAGEISVTATSKKTEFTANVTVTDCTGLSASIAVTVKSSLEPFSEEDLAEIISNDERGYFYDGNPVKCRWNGAVFVNTITEAGKNRYGWDYYSGYNMYFIDFAGDKSVGEKSDAVFSCKSYPYDINEQPVTLKIIKNVGTNLWGIFSYINEEEEKLYSGYFCDTVETSE